MPASAHKRARQVETDPVETGAGGPDYRAFLVRIWRDGENDPWCASVTHVVSGESHRFASVEMVWQHIERQLLADRDGEEAG